MDEGASGDEDAIFEEDDKIEDVVENTETDPEVGG